MVGRGHHGGAHRREVHDVLQGLQAVDRVWGEGFAAAYGMDSGEVESAIRRNCVWSCEVLSGNRS
ncbi:hypothetical protein LINPERPRIM_LOCUS12942 [Linum perenne]